MFFERYKQKMEQCPFFQKQHLIYLFLFCSALLATFLSLYIPTTQRSQVASLWLAQPSLILWNFLPTLLAVCVVYLISAKAVFSAFTVNGIWILFSFADKIKVSMRQEPLLPTDLTLAKEALSIVKTFPLSRIVLIGFGLFLLFALLILTFLCSGNATPSWKHRGIGLLALIVIGTIINQAVYANTEKYDTYPTVDNPYFQVNQYNSRGLVYSFFHQVNISRIKPPAHYQKEIFDDIYAEETTPRTKEVQPADQPKPHIVMIMGEAYSDLSKNKNISFDGHVDPMAHFKALCADENAVGGHIVVPNYGGGTSNTEYDTLTGLPKRFLNTPLPAYHFIHQDIDALPRRLQNIGYETVSIHPGYAWFYNRQNVFPHMGFETRYFLEDSFDLTKQGVSGYINEEATFDKIISVLDEHIASSEKPLFSFTTTIQNHGPYEKKFGTLEQNFNTDIPLTAEESELLTQYFHGIADSDIQLKRLTDYAEQSDEPIIVIYFGDHLPGFTNGMDFFDILNYPINANGTPEEQLAMYETPFLIWANDSAATLCNFQQRKESANLPKNGIISSFYLGALATELASMDELSPLYTYINALRKEYPVLSNQYHVDIDGNYTTELPEDMQQKLDLLKGWQYYILFDQK